MDVALTKFSGYEKSEEKAKLLNVREMGSNKYLLIFDKTPFYAESGGQVGDIGEILGENFVGKVIDTQKQKDIFFHTVEYVRGKADVGKEYELKVNLLRRMDISKNHTATHLLHKALKEVLGTHIQQAGSLVEADKLRFDFSHYEALTEEQLEKIENIVNEKVREAIKVGISYHTMDEAKTMGAVMLFGDKYGDIVRVVDVPEFSTELCGGIHIDNIGKIGLFKIISEGGIAAGVRRIEAKTGYAAYLYQKEETKKIEIIAKKVKTNNIDIVEKVERLVEALKEKEREIESIKQKLANFESKSVLTSMEDINGIKVLLAKFSDKKAEDLRAMVDAIKDKESKAVVVLASTLDDKIAFTVGVTKNLTEKIKAGDLVKYLAEATGGKGGGRPDFAQAGGKDLTKLEMALKEVRNLLKEKL